MSRLILPSGLSMETDWRNVQLAESSSSGHIFWSFTAAAINPLSISQLPLISSKIQTVDRDSTGRTQVFYPKKCGVYRFRLIDQIYSPRSIVFHGKTEGEILFEFRSSSCRPLVNCFNKVFKKNTEIEVISVDLPSEAREKLSKKGFKYFYIPVQDLRVHLLKNEKEKIMASKKSSIYCSDGTSLSKSIKLNKMNLEHLAVVPLNKEDGYLDISNGEWVDIKVIVKKGNQNDIIFDLPDYIPVGFRSSYPVTKEAVSDLDCSWLVVNGTDLKFPVKMIKLSQSDNSSSPVPVMRIYPIRKDLYKRNDDGKEYYTPISSLFVNVDESGRRSLHLPKDATWLCLPSSSSSSDCLVECPDPNRDGYITVVALPHKVGQMYDLWDGVQANFDSLQDSVASQLPAVDVLSQPPRLAVETKSASPILPPDVSNSKNDITVYHEVSES